MAQLDFPLSSDGPTLEVVIGLPAADIAALKAARQPVPPLRPGAGIAGHSMRQDGYCPVDRPTSNASPMGATGTRTAGGSVQVQLHLASLAISGPGATAGPTYTRPTLLVTQLAHTLPNLDVLVGLDILFELITNIDGPAQRFCLTF
jgi:hypothetical protein